MKKIKSLKEVLNNLILTEEERKLLEAWVPYLDQEQHDDLIDEAWQAGAEEYFAELAYDNLFPVYVRAIERTLRAQDAQDTKLTAAEELEIRHAQMDIQHFEEVAQENLDEPIAARQKE